MYGSTLYTMQVGYNEKIGNVDFIPTKEKYEFLGWCQGWSTNIVDVENYVVTENTSFWASFEQVIFTICFYDNKTLLSEYEVNKGEKVTDIPTPLGRNGFIFNGWTQSDYEELVNFDTYYINSNKTFYARYVVKFSGTFEGEVDGGIEKLVINTKNDGTGILGYYTYSYFKITTDLVTVDGNHIFVDVSGRDNQNLKYTLFYNANDDTWIYRFVYNGKNYDSILTRVENDLGVK